MNKNDEQSAFSNRDMEIGSYRRISPLAITMLVFALIAAVVALANKAFIFLPLVVALLSMFTLLLMHRSKQKLMGYTAAVLAMFVSLLSFTGLSFFQQQKYNFLESTAIEKGAQWLEMLKTNRPHTAFQMHHSVRNRKDKGFNLVDHYGSIEKPKEAFGMYLELEPEKSIMADGQDANIEVERVVSPLSKIPRTQDFFVVYRYTREGEPEPRRFVFRIRRLDSLIIGPQWHVIGIQNLQPETKRELPKELEDASLKG